MEQIFIFSCIAGGLAIIYGFTTARQVLGMSAGTKNAGNIQCNSNRSLHILKDNILLLL